MSEPKPMTLSPTFTLEEFAMLARIVDAYEKGEFVICPASIYVRKLEARFNDWLLVDDAGEVSVQPRPSESSHDWPACAMFRGGKCTCDK